MEKAKEAVLDGNEATALVAYKTNEVIAIYPITPSSAMGEFADTWASQGQKNLWGEVPRIQEMQSEGGAAGAVHGALQAGSLTTTFTASQGLLLMLPNLFKIAGELTSAVIHVAARAVATHALSIFGDHSDVMSMRSAGWAMLFSSSVQEAHDMALIAQAATLKARLPFLHIFDGFRTSHEVMKIKLLDDETMRAMLDEGALRAHRERALTPEAPVLRGTAQNPDVFFQSREASNRFYAALPQILAGEMERLAALTGRFYRLFDYVGHPEAERVILMMGSGCETTEEVVNYLVERGERVGLVKVRLFQPFSISHLLDVLPKSLHSLAILDRTKEPAAPAEPLYQAVTTALFDAFQAGKLPKMPRIVGGRYGLGSKEYDPAMVKAILDELAKEDAKRRFTVGIVDDVTHLSLASDPRFTSEDPETMRALFWGLGADGTVGANKNSIKIIGEATDLHTQAYFVYDSKKSGARTISHLRFGKKPIKSAYLLKEADFVGVHQWGFLERYPVLDQAREGATILINAPFAPDEIWAALPPSIQATLVEKKLKLYAIDAYQIARSLGLGTRINTIMQACFFALSQIIPQEEAIERIKEAIRKTYGKRGPFILRKNEQAVDQAIASMHEMAIPIHPIQTAQTQEMATKAQMMVTGAQDTTGGRESFSPALSQILSRLPADAPAFLREVTAPLIAEEGEGLPVSKMSIDGTFPTGTTQFEKRSLALEIPVWEEELCIQCGKCVVICPHAVIRAKRYEVDHLRDAPEGFKSVTARWREASEEHYTLQVAPDDCTGCQLCVEICPVKDKSKSSRKAINMQPLAPRRDEERERWAFFKDLPEMPLEKISPNKVKDIQLLQPLFEFSGACAGCGETPYLKMLSQLFGDRAVIANATGCSSIYGGNLPTTPWRTNPAGRGPAWSNSLFEDNAEFGLGMRLAIDQQSAYARRLVKEYAQTLGEELADALLAGESREAAAIAEQRRRVLLLRERLASRQEEQAVRDLLALADLLIPRDVWIVGGDGWAYDIGFGGVDHVLSSGLDVNLLVLDTEVYSNTGGQSSKATPRGAVAKFAASGKQTPKKDLGMLAMSYKTIYVASVAIGADDMQTLRAFREAEAYPGPSLIIAYSPCIAHGIDMTKVVEQQRLAVETGYWLLYRYHPEATAQGKNPLSLDSKPPKTPLKNYLYNELRYSILTRSEPDLAARFLRELEDDLQQRYQRYQAMADAAPHPQKEKADV
jgi:pyruvate-ferredoxin/flavodoxin oxidoreductase